MTRILVRLVLSWVCLAAAVALMASAVYVVIATPLYPLTVLWLTTAAVLFAVAGWKAAPPR